MIVMLCNSSSLSASSRYAGASFCLRGFFGALWPLAPGEALDVVEYLRCALAGLAGALRLVLGGRRAIFASRSAISRSRAARSALASFRRTVSLSSVSDSSSSRMTSSLGSRGSCLGGMVRYFSSHSWSSAFAELWTESPGGLKVVAFETSRRMSESTWLASS